MPEVFTQSDPPKLIETGEELAQKLQAPLIQLTTHKDLISKGEDDAEEENLIVGTNTPRAKRSSAYYDLLCAQGSHGRSAACRGMDAAESAVRGVEQAVSYQDDSNAALPARSSESAAGPSGSAWGRSSSGLRRSPRGRSRRAETPAPSVSRPEIRSPIRDSKGCDSAARRPTST